VIYLEKEMENFLKVLGDETRLKIIDFINRGKRTSIEIQEALKKSQSTISQHMKVLVEEDILTFDRDSAKKLYRIKNPEILNIISIINAYLEQRNHQKVEEISDSAISDTLKV